MEDNSSAFEPMHLEYSRHLTSGILNSGAVQIVKVLCQFISVAILSRLLLPSDFGLIAMASPVVGFVALFQDLGLNQATIQKPGLTHEEVNAFFWINTSAGLALTLLLISISPIVGWYYNEPRAATLTAAIGLLVFVSGLGNQHSAILQRRMRFDLLRLTGIIGALAGLISAILVAWIFRSYWAIYVSMVIGTIVPTVGVWLVSSWRPTRPTEVIGLGKMLKFGVGITSSSVSAYIARNADNVLIGHRWGEVQLGLYDRGYKLLLFPLQRIIDPMSGVMIPILSRLLNEPFRYRGAFLKAMSQLALAAWPGIIWAIVLAKFVIPTVLGRNWSGTIPMFVPLALAGLLQVINGLTGWLFISQGRTNELARWAIIDAVSSVFAFAVGLPYGATGVAIAYAISEFLRTPVLWWYVTRSGPIKFRDISRVLLPNVCGGLVAVIALEIVSIILEGLQPWILIIICGFLSYAATTLCMLLFVEGRETLGETSKLVGRTLKHMLASK